MAPQLAGKAQQAYATMDDVPELIEHVSAPEEKCLKVTAAQIQWQYTEEKREKKLNESWMSEREWRREGLPWKGDCLPWRRDYLLAMEERLPAMGRDCLPWGRLPAMGERLPAMEERLPVMEKRLPSQESAGWGCEGLIT